MAIYPYRAYPDSVQQKNNAADYQLGMWNAFEFGRDKSSQLIPSWGHWERDRELHKWFLNPTNVLGQSALGIFQDKVCSAAWDIVGTRDQTRFQKMLADDVNFGEGWDDFLAKLAFDYCVFDFGAVVEVRGNGIVPSIPMDTSRTTGSGQTISQSYVVQPPIMQVTGVAYLDPTRCYATGDPEYPIVYQNESGIQNLMHRTRVYRLIDSPQGREKGLGLSAASRMFSVIMEQALMRGFIREMLANHPADGMLIYKNVDRDSKEAAMNEYNEMNKQEGNLLYRPIIELYGDEHADVKYLSFSQAPERFDYEKYNAKNVNETALAFKIDVQEMWQLMGGNLGTASQSDTLDKKNDKKGDATFLSKVERMINWRVLPRHLELRIQTADDDQSEVRSRIALNHAQTAQVIAEKMGMPQSANAYLVAVLPAYRDATNDIQELPSNDPKSEPAQDRTPVTQEKPQVGSEPAPVRTPVKVEKALAQTQKTFSEEMEEIIRKYNRRIEDEDGELVMRDISSEEEQDERDEMELALLLLLLKHGERAIQDATREELGSQDKTLLASWLATKVQFVKRFAEAVVGSGLTNALIPLRARMWAGNSIRGLYHDALQQSGNASRLYMSVYNPSAKHCRDCITLNGVVKTLAQWKADNQRPGDFGRECGAGCQCNLRAV